MADQKQEGPKSKSRKTVRKTSAPYTLDSDAASPEPEEEKGESGQGGESEAPPVQPPAEGASAGQEQTEEAQPGAGEPAGAPAEAPEAPAPPEAGPPEPSYATLPAPSEIEPGDPETDAPPPGPAPPGDSRSFRRQSGGVEEFCLIYRRDNFLVTRSGVVGKNGTWNIVEYPSVGAAAHAYAQECSELAGRGFYDLPGA